MAEQADAMVSNTIDRKVVRVRFPLRAPMIPPGQADGYCSALVARGFGWQQHRRLRPPATGPEVARFLLGDGR